MALSAVSQLHHVPDDLIRGTSGIDMNFAPRPPDERQRLEALFDLDILDTPGEEQFDSLVEIATHLFDAPMGYVGFIDRDREWFKSCKEFESSNAQNALEFCSHTILSYRPFLVCDTLLDPRFAFSRLAQEQPYIRFYAGAQIRTFDDHCVGTLCVLDTEPRDPVGFDTSDLELLARIGTQLIEFRRVGAQTLYNWRGRKQRAS